MTNKKIALITGSMNPFTKLIGLKRSLDVLSYYVLPAVATVIAEEIYQIIPTR